MGGQSGQVRPETTGQVLVDYIRYLPGLMRRTANAQTDVAKAGLKATEATQPGYNALNLSEAQKNALPLAKVGQDVSRSNALAGAETNLAQIMGAGGQAGVAATNLNRLTNPDYYRAQGAASRGAESAVNAISLNGLSPGEQNAIERGLNQNNSRTGNLGINNATNMVANAMNFGGAFNSKIPLMNQAAATASGVANSAASNGGVNAPNIALGQPNVSTMGNFGTGTFSNTNAGTQNASAGNAFGFSNGLMGNMFNANNVNSSGAYQLATSNSLTNSLNGAGSASAQGAQACCFIFLEIHNGVLPWYVRVERDLYYEKNPKVANGYKKMAKWLVPLMRKFNSIKQLINWTMVKPLTYFGGWKHNQNKWGWICYPIKQVWFTVWNNS